jgi:tetratricopeptide (TPR) repeat protein
MKLVMLTLAAATAISVLVCLAGISWFGRPAASAPQSRTSTPPVDSRMKEEISRLGRELEKIKSDSAGAATAAANSNQDTANRIKALESEVERLGKLAEIVVPAQSADTRAALFSADDGYVKADEFFELEKYVIAGEGYLTFLQKHPDHPDAHDIMKRAREAFRRAGYTDKAFWVQQEMMKAFPQQQAADMMELAMMEKDARRYDDAINHAAESAALAANDEDRFWRLLYRAWYVELRDGPEASLSAYREVQSMIDAAGFAQKGPGNRARDRIADLEQRIAAGRQAK